MSAAEAVCETRINGFSILFPEGKKPFAPQLAVISKVLKALKDKENALLESPTGTGKVILYT
jgi:Fanconi anemia group J protein